MTANELRIGNFINYLGKIIECNINTIYAFSTITQPSKIYLPIPVTEEWLLKFAFINNGFCYELKDFKILIHANKDFQFTVIYKDLDICGNIKYIHKLQNLYFALTGEELVVSDAIS